MASLSLSQLPVFNRQDIAISKLPGLLLIIMVVTFGLHARFVVSTQTIVEHPIRADASDYYHYAKNLKDNSIYSRQAASGMGQLPEPDALRSPGFPAFASLFMSKDRGASIVDVVNAQTVIQILAFLLLTIVFISMLGIWWSILPVTILWSFPHFITFNTYYLSESVFISLLAFFISVFWWGTRADRSTGQRLASVAVAGLLVGLASLVRPVMEYFPLFILLITFIFDRKHVKEVVLFAGTALLPVIAWKIRNLLTLGVLSDPTLMINALYHGSFPGFMYNNDPATLGFPYRFDPQASQVYEGIGATLSLIFQRAIADPASYLYWYLIGKQFYLWQWSILAGQGDMFIYPVIKTPYSYMTELWGSYRFHYLIHNMWVILGLIGSMVIAINALRYRKLDPVWVLMSMVVIYAVCMHVIVAPFPRYGVPFKLMLIPVGIFTIKEALQWAKGKI